MDRPDHAAGFGASAPGPGTLLIAPHRFSSLAAERKLAAEHGVELVEAADRVQFADAIPDAAVIMLTPYAQLDADAMARARCCRAVVRYGAGVDNVDLGAATAAGIPVANVPDAAVEEVALHAVALSLALARRMPAAQQVLRGGDWSTDSMAGLHRFSTLTAGVVGLGRIGSLTANHLRALGATVIAHDPDAVEPDFENVRLEELLERADLISLHVPLTASTRDMLSHERIRRLRPGVIVVNVSRGGLVDESALAEALIEGRLGGAGIDVFADEPLGLDSPLLGAPNTILTPHVAWRSEESRRDYQLKAIAQAELALSGEPMANVVNAGAGVG